LFLLLRGSFDNTPAPIAVVLADDEFERVGARSRTFRTAGDRVEVIQLRIDRARLRVPIGLVEGPIELPARCWDAAHALMREPDLEELLAALAATGIVDAGLSRTLCADEPERFRRLWAALQPLFATHGAAVSLKQLAGSLDMSMRQIGRDAKELADAFGIGGGFRDALLVVRLRTACLLLSAPGATVADVAKAAGYGSPIAMARAFRDARLPSPSAVQEAVADPIRRRG
jgi:AraC-like DNA-binding protein